MTITIYKVNTNFFEKYGAKEIAFIENGWGKGMHKIDMCIEWE